MAIVWTNLTDASPVDPAAHINLLATRVNAALAAVDAKFPAWQSFTPALTASATNPNLGAGGTISGRYARVGTVVNFQVRIKWGSTGQNPGSGGYRISLPPIAAVYSSFTLVGGALAFDASTASRAVGVCALISSTQVEMISAGASFGNWTHGNPYPWGNGDIIEVNGTYEAA